MLVQVSTDRLVSWPESSIILLFWVFVCWVHPLFCCAGCPNALLPVFPPAHPLFLPLLAGFELQLQLSTYFQPCMLAGSCCAC